MSVLHWYPDHYVGTGTACGRPVADPRALDGPATPRHLPMERTTAHPEGATCRACLRAMPPLTRAAVERLTRREAN